MSILDQLACKVGRRDEVPNQELARQLATEHNSAGIAEIALHLWDPDERLRSDCLKVLYEIGYLAPELIAVYVADFMRLLADRNNRMVWGGMIALSTIAFIQAEAIWSEYQSVIQAIERGSVITQDAGIKMLSVLAASQPDRQAELTPYLMQHLAACRASDLPRRAEAVSLSVDQQYRSQFAQLIGSRMGEVNLSGQARLRKLLRQDDSNRIGD